MAATQAQYERAEKLALQHLERQQKWYALGEKEKGDAQQGEIEFWAKEMVRIKKELLNECQR